MVLDLMFGKHLNIYRSFRKKFSSGWPRRVGSLTLLSDCVEVFSRSDLGALVILCQSLIVRPPGQSHEEKPERQADTKTNRINFPLSSFQNRRQLTYEGSL